MICRALNFGPSAGHGGKPSWWWLVPLFSLLISCAPSPAAPLMEEGFNYPAGTALAANPPWAGGNGLSVGVVGGNLTQTNLSGILPAGNELQIGGGTSRTVYRNFTDTPVTGGAVYLSALFQCTLLPTNAQFIASLMVAGRTSPNQPDDPLDLYVTPAANGYTFRVGHNGDDPVTANLNLNTNEVHLIVLKYAFGSGGRVSLYVDPLPGNAEPNSANARTEAGEGTDAANLQILLFHSPNSALQGNFYLDSVRVGTNWADVTPSRPALALEGPDDQAVCSGSGAMFGVQASGTPLFTYQWRTNATPVPGATNALFFLPGSDAALAAIQYDVVVNDAFGVITSRVASLTFTTNAPGLVTAPASQLVMPGESNAVFSVAVSGDPPLTYQWRTNGIAIAGETNTSYTVNHPGPADATNAIDVVVANPCGAITSSPPVTVVYPNQFYEAFDAGAGFFGGENLIFTNTSGVSFYAWSSPTLSVPVTDWTPEGPMFELPLGTTGQSRYSFNANPAVSPVYYIFATTNTGPYLNTEPLVWLTTADYASFTVTSSNEPISAAGLFNPNSFQAAYDAGPGFFGGENLIFTNVSGLSFSVWSSPDLSVSVTNWNNEGPMFELPLGTTGLSRYSFNANPAASPEYYICALANTGNFTPTEPLVWLTTGDFVSFAVLNAGIPITPDGLFQFPIPPSIVVPPQSQTVFVGQSPAFTVTASGSQLTYQWLKNNGGVVATATPALTFSNVSTAAAGAYFVIVTNPIAAVTSSVAMLNVVPPPALKSLPGGSGGIQFNTTTITGLTYVVETATNLTNPVWQPVLTNNTGSSGLVSFQTNASAAPSQFYRLVFP